MVLGVGKQKSGNDEAVVGIVVHYFLMSREKLMRLTRNSHPQTVRKTFMIQPRHSNTVLCKVVPDHNY